MSKEKLSPLSVEAIRITIIIMIIVIDRIIIAITIFMKISIPIRGGEITGPAAWCRHYH